MGQFNLNEAFLLAVWAGTALWGIFTCVFIYALHVLRHSYVGRNGHVAMYITGTAIVILYLLATTYMCLGLFQIWVGFIQTPSDQQLAYFGDNTNEAVNQAKNFIYLFSLWISDGVIVWRCSAIWNYDKRVMVLPILLLLMTIATSLIAESQFLVPAPSVPNAGRWGEAEYALSLTVNVGTTLLTAGRLWYLASLVSTGPGKKVNKRYKAVMLVVIDSAALLSTMRIIEFVLFELIPSGASGGGNYAFYTVSDMMPQISGIVPTAIVLVVHSRNVNEVTKRTTVVPETIAFRAGQSSASSYPMDHMSNGGTTDSTGMSIAFAAGEAESGDSKGTSNKIISSQV